MLDPPRKQLIRSALVKHPLQDVLDACKGLGESSWHRENKKDSLEILLRDSGQIETFRDLHREPPTPGLFARTAAASTQIAELERKAREHENTIDSTATEMAA